ncbi:uncharacterized protein FTOL_13979 [Fusarium torulosum]|uniref:Uncharacterized protein n=1 Tax=Fusarium torulosum TaxID=33205 RepID=A0AAE8MPZ5_9HYPO|nr:uncharacterized protein FTOL_13979 [Fusarium torulosum]
MALLLLLAAEPRKE